MSTSTYSHRKISIQRVNPTSKNDDVYLHWRVRHIFICVVGEQENDLVVLQFEAVDDISRGVSVLLGLFDNLPEFRPIDAIS